QREPRFFFVRQNMNINAHRVLDQFQNLLLMRVRRQPAEHGSAYGRNLANVKIVEVGDVRSKERAQFLKRTSIQRQRALFEAHVRAKIKGIPGIFERAPLPHGWHRLRGYQHPSCTRTYVEDRDGRPVQSTNEVSYACAIFIELTFL